MGFQMTVVALTLLATQVVSLLLAEILTFLEALLMLAFVLMTHNDLSVVICIMLVC